MDGQTRRPRVLLGAGAGVADVAIAVSAWSGLSGAPTVGPSPAATPPAPKDDGNGKGGG